MGRLQTTSTRIEEDTPRSRVEAKREAIDACFDLLRCCRCVVCVVGESMDIVDAPAKQAIACVPSFRRDGHQVAATADVLSVSGFSLPALN